MQHAPQNLHCRNEQLLGIIRNYLTLGIEDLWRFFKLTKVEDDGVCVTKKNNH